MTFRGDHPDELISASLTGDLTDEERAALDAHLAHCERCRGTLAAFKSERRILSGLPVADPPRDLSARVRGGIESGRFGVPWWRRPGRPVQLLASAAVFATAVVSVVYFGHLLPAPVGQASGSPVASPSSNPTASPVASTAPSVGPSAPPTFLAAGQLGYLELGAAPLGASHLRFVNDATGALIEVGKVGTTYGAPIAASLSPDGQWLAFITEMGETGANSFWALHLSDGTVKSLGCSLAAPFADRLAWSPDSKYLAYTLVGVDLGPAVGCQAPGTGADVWLLNTVTGANAQLTTEGNAYAADFVHGSGDILWVSYAAAQPHSDVVSADPCCSADIAAPQGVFLPLISPDGHRALFWSGTMAESGGMWELSHGGMPQLSGDLRSTGPASPWVGTPLFADLTPVGGEAFAYGSFAWSADSNWIAFWNGAWTGSPQSADGTYPSQSDWYEEAVGTPITAASRHGRGPSDQDRIVDITFGPSNEMAVAIGFPSAGIGDPPSAIVEVISICCGGDPQTIGGGVTPPLWDGPAVFGH